MWLRLIFLQDIKSRLLNISVKHLLLVLSPGCCLGTHWSCCPVSVSCVPCTIHPEQCTGAPLPLLGKRDVHILVIVVPADLHQR